MPRIVNMTFGLGPTVEPRLGQMAFGMVRTHLTSVGYLSLSGAAKP
ncbi:MAG: hypothetical protein KDA92_00425 [Planctomycetales bacterium]|nr:hypothetical protein [Planctomycetales bacterium]MCA9166993.1 hypothetical protein [Planctomycetales bacterium]